ncbi:uncharacterized protein LOC111349182 [Spodoptera litura]|uniref:Uncharacterized protein LOC111349182 n=1 Tax=Spodoptera litura TaxID=69820 RepID=A0A9J7DTB2_SPOLT|nr:uncharacterized protein LOC111349182 [Spodoptera litura]
MILFLVAVVVTVAARPQHGHQQKRNHGHIFLPQKILLHRSHDVNLNSAYLESHGDNHREDFFHGEHHYPGPHMEHFEELLNPNSSSESIKRPNEKEPGKHSENYIQPESDYELGDPYIVEKKSQQEPRAVAKGVYSLDHPDDSVKITKYYTDRKSGCIFQIFPRLIQN